MNKVELVATVCERLAAKEVKASKKEMTTYVGEILDTIVDTVVAGEDVKLTGFGNFTRAERGAREGRNPATGEALTIPATKAPKFKASAAFKEAVKAQ